MANPCEENEVLISGYLDGELGADEARRLEEHLKGCSVCRREYELMKQLVVGTTRALQMEPPPKELWDTFLEGVYNRLERKTGWLFLIAGSIALTLYGMYVFYTDPWGSALVKVLITMPCIGLALLFISVLRQRLRIARTDRYSKEVER